MHVNGEQKTAAAHEPQLANSNQPSTEDIELLTWVNWEAFMRDMADTSEFDAMNVAYQQFTITMLIYTKL